MKIKFWGVRGSIACPGPKTLKYGGNTSCIEIRSDDNDLIILDAGTGIFQLAQTLFPELPLTCHIFITHTHWDHIQGLPFFIPSFIPGNNLNIYGAFDPVEQRGISSILARQLEYSYFPVREEELKATTKYVTLAEHQTVQAGSAKVTNIFMNHPVLNFGYKIECNGKTVFFTGDHEELYNLYAPEDEDYHKYEKFMTQKNKAILDFVRGVDVLIADTSYTRDDYPAKQGWGHGTFDGNMRLAKEAGVKTMFFTHHEPTRDDANLEKVFQEALDRHPRKPGDPEYLLAQEGLEFEL
ncbi:MAG: MBL fold metallo-hydrolase [Magnetococcales bacterium]|nr:MBL fold metallo-hydrolase [Magnetococcales bacterium]